MQTDVTDVDQVRRLVDHAVKAAWPHRRHHQQCRADAALAAGARQGRGLGPDDRRQHQGRALRHRRRAAAHEEAEERPHHQCLVGRRPQGRAGRRRLCRHQARGARHLGRAAAGGEALQHPHHDHLAGRGGDGTAATASPRPMSPKACASSTTGGHPGRFLRQDGRVRHEPARRGRHQRDPVPADGAGISEPPTLLSAAGPARIAPEIPWCRCGWDRAGRARERADARTGFPSRRPVYGPAAAPAAPLP